MTDREALGRNGCLGLIVGTCLAPVISILLVLFDVDFFVITLVTIGVVLLPFMIGHILDDINREPKLVEPFNRMTKEPEQKTCQNNILFPPTKKPTNVSNTTSLQVSNLQKEETQTQINCITQSIKSLNNPVHNTMKQIEMKDMKTPKQLGEYIFTLLSVERDVIIKCDEDCCYFRNEYLHCPEKTTTYKRAGIKLKNGQIECIKVVLNIKYLSNDKDSFYDSNISLIDSHGYIYEGCEICRNCLNFGFVTGRYDFYAPSQINYIVLFSNLSPDIEFSKLRITNHYDTIDFLFTDEPNKVEQLITEKSLKSEISEQSEEDNCSLMDTIKLNDFKESVYRIKLNIHKIFYNKLDSNAKQKLKEKIENQSYMLNIRIEGYGLESNPIYVDIIRDYRDSMEQYEMHCMAMEEFDKQEEIKIQKISELLNIDPYMFEQLSAQMLSGQGFENIEVTPRSNDRGVDIICYKNGLQYVVQCKRYANAVGSPDMQRFIGALQNAKADVGLFITTSTFTKEAKIMANNNNIELVDKHRLVEWLPICDAKTEEELFD